MWPSSWGSITSTSTTGCFPDTVRAWALTLSASSFCRSATAVDLSTMARCSADSNGLASFEPEPAASSTCARYFTSPSGVAPGAARPTSEASSTAGWPGKTSAGLTWPSTSPASCSVANASATSTPRSMSASTGWRALRRSVVHGTSDSTAAGRPSGSTTALRTMRKEG